MIKRKTHKEYTIGWVCALPKELIASVAMLDEEHQTIPTSISDHNAYTLGSIGDHNIVMAALPKGVIGNSSAATVATQMVDSFPSIKFVLMVGIGGGIPPKVRLGDVVVSTPVDIHPGVVQWDLGKATDNGFQRIGILDRPPRSLLTALAQVEKAHAMHGSSMPKYLEDLGKRFPRLASKFATCEGLTDVAFKSNVPHMSSDTRLRHVSMTGYDEDVDDEDEEDDEDDHNINCRFCDTSRVFKKPDRPTKVHFGLVASGNMVVKNSVDRNRINKDLGGNVLCIEMEAAGIASSFPCLVIRGICDYADAHKNKDWQEYAAATAAAFTKELLLEYVQAYQVEEENTVLSQIKTSVSRIEESFQSVANKWQEEEDMKVLDWLTTIHYGKEQTNNLRKKHSGTCEWIFENEVFQTWRNAAGETLFCSGDPGTGKSVLTACVVDYLLRSHEDDLNIGIAYIYFNFDDRSRGQLTVEDTIASLVRQLAQRLSRLPDNLQAMYMRHQQNGTHPTLEELTALLSSIIKMYQKVFVAVDALDECDRDFRGRFATEILETPRSGNLNIFWTSRSIPDIKSHFKGNLRMEIRSQTEDIAKYLEDNLPRIGEVWQNITPLGRSRVLRKAKVAVDGKFLLAKLLLNNLANSLTENGIFLTLQEFQTASSGSDSLYEDVYGQTIKRIRAQPHVFAMQAMRAISWIVTSKRPLTTLELQHALAIVPGNDGIDIRDVPNLGILLSACCGLVIVDAESHILRLCHSTAKRYFDRNRDKWFPEFEAEVARKCITYLLYDNFSTGFCFTEEDYLERLDESVFYDYAARNWGHHVYNSKMDKDGKKLVIHLLENDSAVSACGQALIGYEESSHVFCEKWITGAHLAAYFGLLEPIKIMISTGINIEAKDSYLGRTLLLWAASNNHKHVVSYLLKKGSDKEAMGKDGQTALICASANGYKDMAKLLVESHANLRIKDGYHNQTALSWAAENGHEAVVKLLLRNGAEVDVLDGQAHRGKTPLIRAVENGHVGTAKILLDGMANIDIKDENEQSPLLQASKNGHLPLCKLLIERKADVETKDQSGKTPLIHASINDHWVIVDILLKNGARDVLDKDSKTALIYASMLGHESIARLLYDQSRTLLDLSLSSGPFSLASGSLDTSLSCAFESGQQEMIKVLLEWGVSKAFKDEQGRTPLIRASLEGYYHLVEKIVKLDDRNRFGLLDAHDHEGQTPLLCASAKGHSTIVKYLIRAKAFVNAHRHDGRTPLICATENGHTSVIELLLEGGANIELRDFRGQTPLLVASENGDTAVVKLLMAKGANPTAKDHDHQTPISRAAANGHFDTVRLLNDHKVDLNYVDERGKTPLIYASTNGHTRIVQILVDNCVNLNCVDNGGRTALDWACKNSHGAIARLLMDKGAHISDENIDSLHKLRI